MSKKITTKSEEKPEFEEIYGFNLKERGINVIHGKEVIPGKKYKIKKQ